jgi:hypothetical protein
VPEKPWDVAPLTPGDWRYEKDATGSIARFGSLAVPSVASLRCERATRQITLSVKAIPIVGPTQISVVVRTTAGDVTWVGEIVRDGEFANASAPASYSGLDWIAYSRGRISVEGSGMPRLILPVWAEVSRVIEDCRG